MKGTARAARLQAMLERAAAVSSLFILSPPTPFQSAF